MNVVLTNKNYDKLEEMIVLANKFGFNEVLLQPMTIFSKEGEKLKVDKRKELDKYLTKAVKRAKGLGVLTNMKDFIKNEVVERTSEMNKLILKKTEKSETFLSVPCFEPWYNMVILPNGQVGPCAIFGGNGKASILDKSLKEIWFGDYFHEIRERLLKRNLFSFCKNCCVPVFLENTRIRKELERLI
jgi:MoaA/NifB/PqqE/SkfB family radical SAM enzyme